MLTDKLRDAIMGLFLVRPQLPIGADGGVGCRRGLAARVPVPARVPSHCRAIETGPGTDRPRLVKASLGGQESARVVATATASDWDDSVRAASQ